jgi:hypothetical protein
MNHHYHVTWDIDVYAGSPEEAARKVLEIHRDPESAATTFDVTEMTEDDSGQTVRVNLEELGNENKMPALPADHRSNGR